MKNKNLSIKQKQEIIRKKAREILEKHNEGIRYMDLVRKVKEECPGIDLRRIKWEVWYLPRISQDVIKPERGLLILKKYYEEISKGETEVKEKRIYRIDESVFYQHFADYLVNELEECTKAISLGGSRFQDKWGTPDVLGIYKISETEPIRPLPEIISAEIKIDINQLITAFGQACAYKLFSHKVYLVVPKDASPVDLSRLESLCLRFSIGLITFDRNNSQNPDFRIITRAIKSEPDYFYVNEYLRRLDKRDLKELFG
ncbi:MAG: hypothetical protein KatS3mg095_0517 [Candidatus Parcubacteria bacterium]|nr:MAG: hypothetical protein KatS3mg094_052 [Candidatus Parcubacteria bacterium]GIW66619.1 MAG: hypothetical protein KatS3mg095_0517 [Candidatus Parcubacteria bacterium]